MKKTHAKSVIKVHLWENMCKVQEEKIVLQMEKSDGNSSYKPTYLMEYIESEDYEAPHYTIEEIEKLGWVSNSDHVEEIMEEKEKVWEIERKLDRSKDVEGAARNAAFYMVEVLIICFPETDPKHLIDYTHEIINSGSYEMNKEELFEKLKNNAFERKINGDANE